MDATADAFEIERSKRHCSAGIEPQRKKGLSLPQAQRVTITNTGTALLEFFSIAVSANFLESDTCGSGVEPGATCQISLNFVPAKKGKESGTLTIKPNVAGGSTSITLSGTGVGHAKHPHGS